MAKLTGARNFLQEEETQFQFAVSESLFQKTGEGINFINSFQYITKSIPINGVYGSTGLPVTGVDGLYIVPFDVAIHGLVIWNNVAGSAGTTTFDVHRYTSPGTDAGTIFSTKPSIDSTAAAFSYVGIIRDDSVDTPVTTTLGGGTGMTAPALTSFPFNLDQGDALRVDVDAAMTAGESGGIEIYMRPR